MLPFLKNKQMSSAIIAKTKPEGGVEDERKEDEMHPGLVAASEDLLRAVAAKDSLAVAEALQAAFEICEAYPHEEDESLEEAE